MKTMKLYYYETLNPRKACAVAKYLGSPVELVRVDLAKGENKSAEYLAINPNGKVPALTDGDLKLWEADAIMLHLARVAKSDLWPKDEQSQIDVVRWLSWNAQHFTRHAGTLYFHALIRPHLGWPPADPSITEEATGFFKQFAQVLNDHLRGKQYLLGDKLSVADFAVGIALPYAEKAKIPIAGFAEIERWHDRLNQLPGWRSPFPGQTAAAA